MKNQEPWGEKPLLECAKTMSYQAMQALNELRENNQLCDANIVLEDGTTLPVHRAILCACSTYFK